MVAGGAARWGRPERVRDFEAPLRRRSHKPVTASCRMGAASPLNRQSPQRSGVTRCVLDRWAYRTCTAPPAVTNGTRTRLASSSSRLNCSSSNRPPKVQTSERSGLAARHVDPECVVDARPSDGSAAGVTSAFWQLPAAKRPHSHPLCDVGVAHAGRLLWVMVSRSARFSLRPERDVCASLSARMIWASFAIVLLPQASPPSWCQGKLLRIERDMAAPRPFVPDRAQSWLKLPSYDYRPRQSWRSTVWYRQQAKRREPRA